MVDELFKDVPVSETTGMVIGSIPRRLYNFYIDKTTIVNGYHNTRMEMVFVPKPDLTGIGIQKGGEKYRKKRENSALNHTLCLW